VVCIVAIAGVVSSPDSSESIPESRESSASSAPGLATRDGAAATGAVPGVAAVETSASPSESAESSEKESRPLSRRLIGALDMEVERVFCLWIDGLGAIVRRLKTVRVVD
jgi:hypothetical protein